MKRDFSWCESEYDVVIIGGGATGLGVALDCASRGYKTLIIDESDFAKGTSSRSTKLLHGGVRYLAQGDIALVKEALRERTQMIKNAPHLCRSQAFIIPTSGIFSALYYYIGLSIYDMMAGNMSLGRTKLLNTEQANNQISNISQPKLRYGVKYFDGQFDDARAALCLAQTAKDHGACVMNYAKATELIKEDGKITGVVIEDQLSHERKSVTAKCVFNTTGVFTNAINEMDHSSADVVPSQGIHLVFDKKFLEGQNALMVPKTSDGRVLFAIPWHSELVVGTTDTLVDNISYEPRALESEIEFILETAKDYFATPPKREDIKSIFVGLRPLAKPSKDQETKKLSRSHKVHISPSNLVSINGGKWTTYRAMAEDGINAAIKHGLLENKACVSQNLKLHGYTENLETDERLRVYGSEAEYIKQLEQYPEYAARIHPDYPYTYAQVKWAFEEEMAISIEDALARRIRLLFLDAKAAEQAAVEVERFCTERMGLDAKRLKLEEFLELCKQYQGN